MRVIMHSILRLRGFPDQIYDSEGTGELAECDLAAKFGLFSHRASHVVI